MKKLSYMFAAVFFLGASASYAGCEFTETPPVIPDGATATEADMLAAQGAIKTYLDHSNAYLDCLAQEASQAGDALTPEARAASDALHNKAVDEQQKLADDFNAQIRAWKAQTAQ